MTMSIALGLLILRLVIGLILAAHGAQKVFGWWGGTGMAAWTAGMTRMRIRPALFWAWISALAELLGGLAFALGLLSPFGSFAIVAAMAVAIALVHWRNGFWNGKRGYEFNLSLLGAAVAVALTGPGSYSADELMHVHLPEPLTLIVGTLVTIAGVAIVVGMRSPAVAPKPETS
jgi:putative oxidoreductase